MQIECADFTWEVGSVYRAHISSSDHSLNWVEVSGELLRLWHQNQELPFCCRGLCEVRHSANAVCGVMGWVCCQKYQALLVLRVELWQQKGKAGKGWGAAQHLFFFFLTYMFVYLAALRISTRGLFPDQGPHLGPLLWEHGVLAAGPPGNSCVQHLNSL